MTAKEQGKEMVNRFKNVPLSLYVIQQENEDIFCLSLKEAKQCALIAVEMIIAANPHSNPLNTEVHSTMKYWMEVKEEIFKL